MYDCRLDGGHFFVHRPQDHAFRCRRCSERFVNSWTNPELKHPWRCIIERCEYIACDPCSTILMEELAPPSKKGAEEQEQEQQQDGEGAKNVDAIEVFDIEQRQRRGIIEAGEEVAPGLAVFGQEMPIMEADEDGDDYEVPPFVHRTARQAAAEAALKRAYVKRSGRHVGRIE